MKYLKKRNQIWYIRISSPPKSWGVKGEFVQTLGTRDLKCAQHLRDKYIIPLLAEDCAMEIVETIGHLLARNNKSVRKRLAEFNIQVGGIDTRLTLEQMFDKAIKKKKSEKSSEGSLDSYTVAKDIFCRFLDKDTLVADIDKKALISIREQMLSLPSRWMRMKDPHSSPDSPRVKPITWNNKLVLFKSCWNSAMKEGLLPSGLENPTLGIALVIKTATKRPLSIDDADKLISLPCPRPIKFTKRMWTYLPVMARYTGARLAELAQLTGKDLCVKQGVLCFEIHDYDEGRKLKTESSRRLVPVSDKLRPILQPLLDKVESGPLFPGRVDLGHRIASPFCTKWNTTAKEVGSHCHFHAFRSYAITQIANNGISPIDRKRIVGHSEKSDLIHSSYTADDLHRFKAAIDTIP